MSQLNSPRICYYTSVLTFVLQTVSKVRFPILFIDNGEKISAVVEGDSDDDVNEDSVEACGETLVDEANDEESKADKQARMFAARYIPLSANDSQRVTAIMRGPANQEELIQKFSIPMTREKILCLRPESWLNDEVINFCMSMLQERDDKLRELSPNRKKSHFFNSFFMDKLLGNGHVGYHYKDVARWTKKFDVFQLDKVFIPVNIANTHWTMAVVLVSRKEIHYYNSMKDEGRKYKNGLLRWLGDETQSKKQTNFDQSGWTLHSPPCPKQENGFDCGMFTMTDDIPVSDAAYSQQHMPFFRRKVASAILRGSYDYPL